MKTESPISPPKWPIKMVEWFCAEEHHDMLIGDLIELYQYRVQVQKGYSAKLRYIKDAFDLLRPFALKKRKSKLKSNRIPMFKNYFKTSFRNMLKHKGYAGINMLGLSIGLCCFLLIFVYVQDEWSYDRYHEHAKDIYRVVSDSHKGDGATVRTFTYTSPMHGVELRENYAQVETSVRFDQWNFPVIKYGEKQFNETFFNFVEPTIFDVFTFNFLEGSAENALERPYTVILTESTAEKYFGEESAVGQLIEYIDNGNNQPYEVIGVIEDFPENSHMSYNFLASWSSIDTPENASQLNDYYGNYNYATYVRLKPNASINELEAQMPGMLDSRIDNIDGFTPSSHLTLRFQKLTSIHLNSSAGAGGTSNAYYVYLFSAIGILVLLIACINYMNLATAKYSSRMKEVGVRKVLGAHRRNVAQQFYVESLSYAIISLLIGYGLALLTLPSVNEFAGKNLSLNPLQNVNILIFVTSLAILVGFLSGSYPATFMSRFGTIRALRGGDGSRKNRSIFRTTLVIVQFTITIGLILGVTVIDRQIKYIKEKDLGYDRELIVNYWASPRINNQLDVVKSELLKNPNILQAATASRIPTGRLGDALGTKVFHTGTEEVVSFRLPFIRIDEDFLDVYGIELLAGEPLVKPLSDSTQLFLINETAMRQLGWNEPNDAIGQRIEYGWYSGFISGITKDFNFESIHSAIQPMIMMNDFRGKRQMSVKISGNQINESLATMEAQFKRINPDRDFNPIFVDQLFDNQYKAEQKLSNISKVFSIIAILIASLGLMGLVSYALEQRSKEISIRKVLGASVSNILLMVNERYAVLIGISFLLATPLAYYFLNSWLETFAYHINIGVGLIVVSGFLTFAIAAITICSQVFKFAMANPIKWLRNE